jgi:PEP-CTERM motif
MDFDGWAGAPADGPRGRFNMRTKNLWLTALAMLGLVGFAPQSHAGLVLDLAGGGTPAPCYSCGASGTTVGWSFTVNSPIRVDGIGVWDYFSSSFPASTEAGLWTSAGALLESESITTASTPVPSADRDGQWLFASFAPITLAPGDYLIGNVFFDSNPVASVTPSITTIPQITLVGAVEGTSDGGLTAPSTSFDFSVYGPTLETLAVPEASTWAMMLLGFAGLGFMGLQGARRSA